VGSCKSLLRETGMRIDRNQEVEEIQLYITGLINVPTYSAPSSKPRGTAVNILC